MKPNVTKLRQTILQLAVEGKLLPQDNTDASVSDLLEQIEREKLKLINEGKLRKSRELSKVPDTEEPFSIPNTWQWVRLGNVTNYASLRKVEPTNVGENTWVLEMEDVQSQTSVLLHKVYSQERQPKSTKNIFEPGDIIYGKLRPYLNKVIVADEAGICTTEMIPIRAYCFSPKFLFYYLKSPVFIQRVNELTKGINLPRLTTSDAIIQPLPLPPLQEQIRIVEKIGELMIICDELENKSDNFLSIISKLRKTTLQLAVEGKLVNQDSSDGSAEELFKQIVSKNAAIINQSSSSISDNEKPYEIPKSWVYVRLGQLVELINGRAFKPTEWEQSGLPIIRIQNLNNPNAAYNYTSMNIDPKLHIHDGQLLLSWSGTPGTSFGAFIWSREHAVLNQHIFKVLFPEDLVVKKYLMHVINVRIYSMLDMAIGGVGLRHLRKGQLQDMVIGLPPIEEQYRIVEKIDETMSLLDKLQSRLDTVSLA